MTAPPPPDRSAPKRPSAGVTMQAVGQMAGVSQVTVSRALSDPSKVSPQTLARIHAAIAATGFVPNALAGALASKKSMLVSALMPSITNIVYSSMLAPFSEELRAHGYQILLSETGFDADAEALTVEAHLSRRPDAILLTGVHHTPRTRRMLLAAGIPVVEVWDLSETPIDLCVGFSHAEAGRRMADFALAEGYRKAAGFTASDERAKRRLGAFAERFTAGGGAPVPILETQGASLAQGRALLASLAERGRANRCLVACSSDILAHGVLIEAAARGLSVPGDLGVIGFGDQDLAAAVQPPLTTIRVNRDALGREAATAILTCIAGGEPAHRVIDVGFSLIRRGSA